MTSPPLVADPTLRRLDERTWTGGTPLRLLRMAPEGSAVLARLATGARWMPAGAAEEALAARLVDTGAAHPCLDSRYVASADLPGEEEVTVVVPVRDDPSGLSVLLGALGRNASLTGARTIVVDDGSLDRGALEGVVAPHPCELLSHPQGRGPAAARNTGLAAVRTPLVLFVDADVDPTGLDGSLLRAHMVDAGTVAVAPRVRGSVAPGALARHDRLHGPLDLGTLPSAVGPGRRVSYVPSATLLARTEAVRAVGGFDESLRFGEDVDLVWRLAGNGGVVRYEPATEVTHRSRDGIRAWLRQRHDYGTSAAELERRHPGNLAALAVSPWSAGAWLSLLCGHPGGAVAIVSYSALRSRSLPEYVAPLTGVRLVLGGHVAAGHQLARAAIRPWWPVSLLAGALSRRARPWVLAAVVAGFVRAPGTPAVRVLTLLDDAAYSVGVWRGCMRSRSAGALLPRTRGPGARPRSRPRTLRAWS